MITNLEPWAQKHPHIIEYFKTLNENNIRWGIYAGGAANLLTDNRPPSDLDIFVHNDDFETATHLTKNPMITIGQTGDITTSTGELLTWSCNNCEFTLDNTDIEVTANLIESVNGQFHDLSFTELAIANRIEVETAETKIYIANPFDTVAIKSIMQRGAEQNKFDLPDSQRLISKCEIDKEYIQERAKQMTLTNREIEFLKETGINI